MTKDIETKLSELEARVAELEAMHKPKLFVCTGCGKETSDISEMRYYRFEHATCDETGYGFCNECAAYNSGTDIQVEVTE